MSENELCLILALVVIGAMLRFLASLGGSTDPDDQCY